MKRIIISLCLLVTLSASAREWDAIPKAYKWLDNKEAVFSMDGSFTDAFAVNAKTFKVRKGVSAPERYADFPIHPENAVNLTYSPDSTMLAFTRDNDLWIAEIASGKETRITFDGSETILNGYASWVYYEEIFGRPSRYRAFWWSPDSRKIAFYRFDNSEVPVFPIYSPVGQDGSLRLTRYPKAGEPNPKVRIGMVSLENEPRTVWAELGGENDCYFGTPFWGPDGKYLYVSREPRIQNTLDLYRVNSDDGSASPLYHEEASTWLNWIENMLFTPDGLYMTRDFETGWQQIYFLGYDGSLRRITDGQNWRIRLLAEKAGTVYFLAERDSRIWQCLYKVDPKGVITPLTDTSLSVSKVELSPDCKHYAATVSNYHTPYRIIMDETARPGRKTFTVADMAGSGQSTDGLALPDIVTITTPDGLSLPGYMVLPKDFDPKRKYPVHVDIYGGPDTPMVRGNWISSSASSQWWSENGIIEVTADCRASGHNGRAGLDMIYRQLDVLEIKDFCEWAEYLRSLPFVDADKIGVEGFSFGGTMTALLVMDHSDLYHYGIAGGGVYDWALYDSHYTERFMETPQTNPAGYEATRAIDHAVNYPVSAEGPRPAVEPVMLKLTHGTGDDNVHFQNTLKLADRLQKEGKRFELMIYPDGMHGYRGYQREHSDAEDKAFWLHYLKGE